MDVIFELPQQLWEFLKDPGTLTFGTNSENTQLNEIGERAFWMFWEDYNQSFSGVLEIPRASA